jgi:hypothetical protein
VVAAPAGGFEVRGSHAYPAAASYLVKVTVTDVDESHDLGGSGAIAHSVASVAPLAIATAPLLPHGTVGAPYEQALAATGGTPPYGWSVTSGSLPAPLALTPAGALAGTPAAPGVFGFTAQVTDAAGDAVTRDFTLPVDSVETSRSALSFFVVAPCRLLDTRNVPDGAFAGPPLEPLSVRTFPVSAGPCGIPADAKAVSANAAATRASMPGSLTLFPGNEFAPGTNSISFGAGQTRACNLLLTLSSDGTASFTAISHSNGAVDFILDMNGYFK